jgi:hypothetical protein
MKRFVFIVVLFLTLSVAGAAYADGDCKNEAAQIQQFIFTEKFKEAEPIVRKCLGEFPESLAFLANLDVVLNGQEKFKASEKVRDRILKIWHRDYEADWIAKGSPVREATWARMIIQSRDYYVVGAEYYTPEPLGNEPSFILSYYKLIAFPKVEGEEARLFKLEMSDIVGKYHVLRESFANGGGAQIIPYGEEKPALHRVVKEAVSWLDGQ